MTTDTNDSWFDPDATTFGDRVAGARERAGMTQGDLAKRLGVKLKTLKAWEDDQSEPRANKLSMMAGLLNVSLLWLLSGEGDGPDTPAVGDLSPDISEMLTEIRDIRAQLAFSTDRLGRIEKSLRAKLREEAGE
jgi:transcriptional regulator with XRE-family HTH domain